MGEVKLTWRVATHDQEVDALLDELKIGDDQDDRFNVALELGVIDGDIVENDGAEVTLRTPRAQILRNIEAARDRGDRTIADLVDAGEISAL